MITASRSSQVLSGVLAQSLVPVALSAKPRSPMHNNRDHVNLRCSMLTVSVDGGGPWGRELRRLRAIL